MEAGELDCDKEISEMYINLFGRYTTLLDNLMDVNVNYNTKKDLLDFLSKEKNISENDFDSIEQINKSRHKTNFINDLLQEMNYFKTAWNTQPFKQISVVLFQLFEALVTKYEEQLKNVSIYVQAPISTSNDKITNESKYLCDLDVLKTKIATNDAQLDSKIKLLHTTDEYYMNIQNKIISLYQQISSMNGLDFTELLSSLKKKEIESFESRINLKNQILTLLQEKETMKTREQFIQMNQQIRTETSFGLAMMSSIEIYDLYKQVYNLFHLPVVMKCYVLLVYGLVNDEIKTKIMDRLSIFYNTIDHSLNAEINNIYDVNLDTKFVNMYDKNINLTNGKSSIIVQDLGSTIKDESETNSMMNYQQYVHVGMCLLKVLKHYISKPETMKLEHIEIFQQWVNHKTVLIKNMEVEKINNLYDQYLKEDKNKCEFVLYEMCNSLYRDPMYRFETKSSDYSSNYMNLQIDYYNTCARLGYDIRSKYNRENAVTHLNNNYQNIAEHYIIDNKLSKVYLHNRDKSNILDTDVYFDTNMIKVMINPQTVVTMIWKIYVIRCKVNNTNIESLIQTLVKHIESDPKHDKTVLKNYDNTTELNTVKDMPSFCITFHWKNSTNTSTVYLCKVSDEHVFEKETLSIDTQIQTEPENIFEIMKQNAFENYAGIRHLMDHCWSKSSLVQFDLPKQNNTVNFGTKCDLSIRKYDYDRIWIIIDTTDSDEFLCPKPYIETSFLRLLNDMDILLELLKNGNNELMRMYFKKQEFLREISSQQVLNKMQRLMNECNESESKCESIRDVYRECEIMFNNDKEELMKIIEHKINSQSFLGKLFHVLGTMDNIIQFNETAKSTVMSRFEKSMMGIFRFFLGK